MRNSFLGNEERTGGNYAAYVILVHSKDINIKTQRFNRVAHNVIDSDHIINPQTLNPHLKPLFYTKLKAVRLFK